MKIWSRINRIDNANGVPRAINKEKEENLIFPNPFTPEYWIDHILCNQGDASAILQVPVSAGLKRVTEAGSQLKTIIDPQKLYGEVKKRAERAAVILRNAVENASKEAVGYINIGDPRNTTIIGSNFLAGYRLAEPQAFVTKNMLDDFYKERSVSNGYDVDHPLQIFSDNISKLILTLPTIAYTNYVEPGVVYYDNAGVVLKFKFKLGVPRVEITVSQESQIMPAAIVLSVFQRIYGELGYLEGSGAS